MGWQAIAETVCCMDATSERTRTYLQRVTVVACQFVSRIEMSKLNSDIVVLYANIGNISGTVVIRLIT
jgi:hypothetical protein